MSFRALGVPIACVFVYEIVVSSTTLLFLSVERVFFRESLGGMGFY